MHLTPAQLTLPMLRSIARAHVPLELVPSCWDAIHASAQVVARIVAADQPAYGINTGFGKLANTHIALDRWNDCRPTSCSRTASAWAPCSTTTCWR